MGILILGVVMLAAGVFGMVVYWWSFVEIFRGMGPFLLVLLGLITIGAQIRSNSKKESVTKKS